MASASACEEVKEDGSKVASVVKALSGFKVTLEKVRKSSTAASILVSLMHCDTFHNFEGVFTKDDLIKCGFDTRSTLDNDLQIVRDAIYGAHKDISLSFGFVPTEGVEGEPELRDEYFDGAAAMLKIMEVYRRLSYNYTLVLVSKELSESERQVRVNKALREKIDAMQAMNDEMQAKTHTLEAKSDKFEAMADMLKAANSEQKRINSELMGAVKTLEAKLTETIATQKVVAPQRSVSFFERIKSQKARTKGWSDVEWNAGHFGGGAVETCAFAQLREGKALITADGDYELCANAVFATCNAFNMQLVVCGTDRTIRYLDAVGGGYHNISGNQQTSLCRVDSIWIPIDAGTTVHMRVFIQTSDGCNLCTCSQPIADLKDSSMIVSSIIIRKLC